MKRAWKNIIKAIMSVAVIVAGVSLLLFAMTAVNFSKHRIPLYDNEVTTATTPEPESVQLATTSEQETSVPETSPPETAPEPSTSPEPEVTEPVTATESVTMTEPVTNDETESVPETETTVAPMSEPVIDGDYIGVVYLTFDDGPSRLTPDYLDVLKEYGVNATFFVLGFSDSQEWKVKILKRALEEGNQIGLHGCSHEYSEVYKSVESATDNFYNENKLLLDKLGVDIRIIRFPGGSSNTVSKNYCKNVMTDAAKELTDNGYNYFDWNVSSSDAGSALKSSEDIYNNVISHVRPSKTNVVLMHDGNGHEATLEALPKIIEWLMDAGYKFEVITDSTPSVRHEINN